MGKIGVFSLIEESNLKTVDSDFAEALAASDWGAIVASMFINVVWHTCVCKTVNVLESHLCGDIRC